VIKIGQNEVAFSASFVMDKHHNNSATVNFPDQPWLEFDLQLKDKPVEATGFSAETWHSFDRVGDRSVLSFDVLPEGKTQFYSWGIGMATQGFDIQIVRQAIWNNFSMLVHVIIVREPR